MTRDDIASMAREAGIPVGMRFTGPSYSDPSYDVTVEVARFAALVAEKEREACEAVLRQAQQNHLKAGMDCEDDSDFIDQMESAALLYGRAADLVKARSAP